MKLNILSVVVVVTIAIIKASQMSDDARKRFEMAERNFAVVFTQNRDPIDQDKYTEDDLKILLAENGLLLSNVTFPISKDCVMEAVKQNGHALRYLTEEEKLDRDIALAGVRQEGLALCWVSPEFACDSDIVTAAVNQNEEAIAYADESLRLDDGIRRRSSRSGSRTRINSTGQYSSVG